MNHCIFSIWFGLQRLATLVTVKISLICCLVSISGNVVTVVILRFYPGLIRMCGDATNKT